MSVGEGQVLMSMLPLNRSHDASLTAGMEECQ